MREASEDHAVLNNPIVRKMAEKIQSLEDMDRQESLDSYKAMYHFQQATSRWVREMNLHTADKGSYLWRVTRLSTDVRYGHSVAYGAPFSTDQKGYQLRAVMNNTVAGEVVFGFQIMPGRSDSSLHWPFAMTVYMTILHHEDERRDLVRKANFNEWAYTGTEIGRENNLRCRKPLAGGPGNEPIEFFKASIEQLQSDGYIFDGTLLVRFSVSDPRGTA